MARALAATTLAVALPFAVGLPCAAAAAERTFTIVTVGGAAPAAQRALRVTQGDVVVVNITSNQAGEVHLHGYNLTAKVSPARAAKWRFTAHATGRYRIEWHAAGDASPKHHGPPLSTLEVLPK